MINDKIVILGWSNPLIALCFGIFLFGIYCLAHLLPVMYTCSQVAKTASIGTGALNKRPHAKVSHLHKTWPNHLHIRSFNTIFHHSTYTYIIMIRSIMSSLNYNMFYSYIGCTVANVQIIITAYMPCLALNKQCAFQEKVLDICACES